ncbi:hypothetical protein Dimus_033236 [Dionaea muscipula]
MSQVLTSSSGINAVAQQKRDSPQQIQPTGGRPPSRRWVVDRRVGDDVSAEQATAEEANGRGGESGKPSRQSAEQVRAEWREWKKRSAIGRRPGKWPPSRKVADGDVEQAVKLSRRRDGEGDDRRAGGDGGGRPSRHSRTPNSGDNLAVAYLNARGWQQQIRFPRPGCVVDGLKMARSGSLDLVGVDGLKMGVGRHPWSARVKQRWRLRSRVGVVGLQCG